MTQELINSRVGVRWGRLTVIGLSLKKNGSQRLWDCVCDCGKTIAVYHANLVSGATKSCGCWHKEWILHKFTKHGLSNKIPEYNIWNGIKQRCRNPNTKQYKDYGGRGISICDRWNDFSNFIKDMGFRPTNKHSIERLDVNGNYEPQNCIWLLIKDQSKNRRDIRYLTINGVTKTIMDWAKENNIRPGLIKDRIDILKWPINDKLFIPADPKRPKIKKQII